MIRIRCYSAAAICAFLSDHVTKLKTTEVDHTNSNKSETVTTIKHALDLRAESRPITLAPPQK